MSKTSSYHEPEWTPNTRLMSEIIQVFNIKGNEDLVRSYCRPESVHIVDVLLEAVRRRSREMGMKWSCEAVRLVRSKYLFPILRKTMGVLEKVTDEVFPDEYQFDTGRRSPLSDARDEEEERDNMMEIRQHMGKVKNVIDELGGFECSLEVARYLLDVKLKVEENV